MADRVFRRRFRSLSSRGKEVRPPGGSTERAEQAIGYTLLMRPRRAIVTRTLRHNEADDGSFDVEFWSRLGPEAIFAAAWEMVSETRAFRGEDGDEPRLQRSLVHVVRRGG
jgi:hypothetical protein